MLSDEECHLIDIPKKYVNSSADVKAVKISEGIIAPFFCCAKYKTLYSWYKLMKKNELIKVVMELQYSIA